MPVFYKKVEAVRLLLTDEQVTALKGGEKFDFEGVPIKFIGGNSYIALLRQGESMVKVSAGQWVIRHPEGHWQVLWPHEFEGVFIEAPDETVLIKTDPFNQKSFKQAYVAL